MRKLFEMSSADIDREYEKQTDRLMALHYGSTPDDECCAYCKHHLKGLCYKHEDDPDIEGEQIVETDKDDWCPEYEER
jgi:hypothetical protein